MHSKSKFRIFALLLGLMLILASTPLTAAAEETAEPVAYGLSSAAILADSAKLPAPANVAWGENYSAEFDKVAASEGRYEIRVYRNGQQVDRGSWRGLFSDRISISCADSFNQSGTYYFTIQALGNTEAQNSDIVTSDTVVYTKPSQALGTPTNLRWEEGDNEFWAVWDPVTSVSSDVKYFVQLYIESPYGMDEKSSVWGIMDECRTEFDSNFGMTEEGVYTFTVRAISTRLDTLANGAMSAHSPKYNLGEVVGNVKDIVEDLLDEVNSGGISPSEMRDELAYMNNAQLASSMQANKDVLKDIKELEQIYNNEMGITVSHAVDSSIGDRMGSGSISVVGAGFNTQTYGQDMVLKFSQPDKQMVVDESQYKNWIQFEIDLEGADDSSDLDVPVQVTMPIPVGVLAENLCILHYHMDGSYETIWPVINSDGTITFTVTRFSVFVFANEVQPDSGSGNGGGNGGTGSGSGSTSSGSMGGGSYGGSSSSSSRQWTTGTGATAFAAGRSGNVGSDGAVNASVIKTELDNAIAATGGDTVTIRTRNAERISAAALKTLASTAAAAGKTAVLHADTMSGDGKDIQGRLYVEPAKLTGLTSDLKLGVYTDDARSKAIEAQFGAFFSNKITVVTMEQQGTLGAQLQVAVKVDLSGMDTTNLALYNYDRGTNQYSRIIAPGYFIDVNGYLHFYTEQGGSVIISNGVL